MGQGKRLRCTGAKGREGRFKENMAFFLYHLQVKQIIWQLNNIRASTNSTYNHHHIQFWNCLLTMSISARKSDLITFKGKPSLLHRAALTCSSSTPHGPQSLPGLQPSDFYMHRSDSMWDLIVYGDSNGGGDRQPSGQM